MRVRRVLKFIGIGLGLVLTLIAVFVLANWAQLSVFPRLPSAYEAKELCSCLFVEGQTQEHCEGFIRQSVVPIDGRTYDMTGKAVVVRALWTESRAHHVSARAGCVLD